MASATRAYIVFRAGIIVIKFTSRLIYADTVFTEVIRAGVAIITERIKRCMKASSVHTFIKCAGIGIIKNTKGVEYTISV